MRIYQLRTQVSTLEKWPSLLLHKGFAHGSVSLKSVFGLCFEDLSGIWMVVSVLKALCVGQTLHRVCAQMGKFGGPRASLGWGPKSIIWPQMCLLLKKYLPLVRLIREGWFWLVCLFF